MRTALAGLLPALLAASIAVAAGPPATIPRVALVANAIPLEEWKAARLADSLARPGRNLTGLSFEARHEIIGKRLELLKQVLPRLSGVAFLTDGEPDAGWRKMYQDAAEAAGVKRLPAPLRSLDDVDRAFAAAVRDGAEAVLVTDGVWVHRSEYQRAINVAAARHRLLVVNERVARTLGLCIPASLRLQADRVIA